MPTMKAHQGENDIEEPPLVDSDLPKGNDSKVEASDSVLDWDSIPKPSTSITTSGSIRKSALGTKSQEIFDKLKTRNNQSQITIEDAFETYQQSEEKDARIKKLKFAVGALFIMVIICSAAAFASTFAAVNLSKESHVSGGVMVGVDPATNNKAIVQVAQATDSKLNLYHALVLDEAHLRTMDEVVYSYYPANGEAKATRTDKVFRVERLVGKDPSDVNVTITLYGNTKIVIAPKEQDQDKLQLFTDGESYPLCGGMRCANFMVDDPDLDVDVLNRKVDIVMGITDHSGSRRLEQCAGTNPDARRLDSKHGNYGCCSTSPKFLMGKATGDDVKDTAKCTASTFDDLHRNNDRGREVSLACYGHDTCLPACDNLGVFRCTCKGNCDYKLAQDLENAGCGKWRWWWCPCSTDHAVCVIVRTFIKAAMYQMPNDCN